MLESQQCMSARYLMFFFYLTNSAAIIPLQYLLEYWLSGYWIARGPMIKMYLIAIFKKLLLLAFVQSEGFEKSGSMSGGVLGYMDRHF